jgi:hypothetical protein
MPTGLDLGPAPDNTMPHQPSPLRSSPLRPLPASLAAVVSPLHPNAQLSEAVPEPRHPTDRRPAGNAGAGRGRASLDPGAGPTDRRPIVSDDALTGRRVMPQDRGHPTPATRRPGDDLPPPRPAPPPGPTPSSAMTIPPAPRSISAVPTLPPDPPELATVVGAVPAGGVEAADSPVATRAQSQAAPPRGRAPANPGTPTPVHPTTRRPAVALPSVEQAGDTYVDMPAQSEHLLAPNPVMAPPERSRLRVILLVAALLTAGGIALLFVLR